MKAGLPPSTRLSVLLRSFAVQGSWNYRTLIGGGFAFALLPVLRRLYAGDPARLRTAARRHSRLFNSHPYLAPVALGAVARLEAEGADPELIERFKTAVRGALGSLGDRLVWAAWRPACVLLGVVAWLAGAPVWAAVAAFLVVYNIGHVALRVWAFRIGLRDGVNVAGRLRDAPVGDAERWIDTAGAFLIGLALPLVAVGGLAEADAPAWLVAAGLGGAGIGIGVGRRARTVVAAALVAFAVVGLLGGSLA